MRRPALVLLTAACVVLIVDLGQKTAAVSERGEELLFHERSVIFSASVVAASLIWCAAILATRSTALALPGGLLLGGAVGNTVSAALWPSHVGTPNPFLLGDEQLGLAFNLADVFVVAAVFVVLPIALAVFVVRNRDRLREPVRVRP